MQIKVKAGVMRFTMMAGLVCLFFNVCRGDEPTQLAGDLPRVLSSEKSPYLIIADVFVPAGKMVTIEAGTVLMFKNFTGIHIQGMLIARGTKIRPVVFTSENDPVYNQNSGLSPTPYDWNGVYIHKDGIGTELDNVKIMFSVKGMVSETKFIRLTDAAFVENGRSNLTIEGQEKEVQPGTPFSYNLSVKDAKVDGVPIRILKDPVAPRRNVTRYAGLAFFLGGSVIGSIFTHELNGSMNDLNTLSKKNLDNLAYKTTEEWKSTRSRRNKNIAVMASGFSAALLGAVAFTWSFNF